MSDSNPPDNGQYQTPRDISVLPTVEERLVEERRKRKEAKQEAEEAYKKRQIDAAEAANDLARSNKNLTMAVIALTAITAGATIYQGVVSRHSWVTAQGTLHQMGVDAQSSSDTFQAQIHHYDATLGQTQVIAQQAVTQAVQTTKLATDTHELAAQAKRQANASLAISKSNESQSMATQKIADNSAGQLDTMQNQLEITDRPWIAVTSVSIPKEFSISWGHPLHWPIRSLDETDTKMYGDFNIISENVGKSVAVDFALYTELFFESAPDSWNLRTEQTRFCEAAGKQHSLSVDRGAALFVGVPRESLTEAFPAILSPSAWQPEKSVLPALIGCVIYRFDNSPKQHQTRFLYLLRNINRIDNKLFRIEEKVPSDGVGFERITGLDYAN